MTPLGLTVYQPDKASPGYTLFAPMTGTDAYLIDMQGIIVHRWQLPYRPALYGYLLESRMGILWGSGGSMYRQLWSRISRVECQGASTRATCGATFSGNSPPAGGVGRTRL